MYRDIRVTVISTADNVWSTIILVLAENNTMHINRYTDTVNTSRLLAHFPKAPEGDRHPKLVSFFGAYAYEGTRETSPFCPLNPRKSIVYNCYSFYAVLESMSLIHCHWNVHTSHNRKDGFTGAVWRGLVSSRIRAKQWMSTMSMKRETRLPEYSCLPPPPLRVLIPCWTKQQEFKIASSSWES